jgi:hypothetical protein
LRNLSVNRKSQFLRVQLRYPDPAKALAAVDGFIKDQTVIATFPYRSIGFNPAESINLEDINGREYSYKKAVRMANYPKKSIILIDLQIESY